MCHQPQAPNGPSQPTVLYVLAHDVREDCRAAARAARIVNTAATTSTAALVSKDAR
jgi:hypothetical protein